MNNFLKALSFMITVLVVSCSVPTELNISELKFENGIYQYKGNPFTGKVFRNEDSGYLEDGKKEGKWYRIRDNDTLNIKSYMNNKEHGLFLAFNKNKDTILYSQYYNGLLSGLTKEYSKSVYEDDVYFVSAIGGYKEGRKEGLWENFYDEGYETVTYKDGILNGKFIGRDLEEEVEGNYLNGAKEGIWITTMTESDPPRIRSIEKYKNDMILERMESQGGDSLFLELINDEYELRRMKVIFYDGNFNVSDFVHGEYRREIKVDVNNTPIGSVKDYYSSGELRWEGQLSFLSNSNTSNDVKEGKCIWYFKNGNKWSEANYRSGQKDGLVSIYSENGEVLEQYEEHYIEYQKTVELKKYASDGTSCSVCNFGKYYGGSCNTCGTVSNDRLLESQSKMPKCSLCGGTGRERNTMNNQTRVCPMCDGKGYRTY